MRILVLGINYVPEKISVAPFTTGLCEHLAALGHRVSIVTDRDTGQARGFGFVEMSANADADRAITELNGKDLDGRALNVNEARPKTERGSGGGQRRNNRW